MNKSISIRNTGVTVIEVFERLAEGYGIDQVLNEYPALTIIDVISCFKLAKEIMEDYVTHDRLIIVSGEIRIDAQNHRIINLSKLREKYPRAYEPWENREDNLLTSLFNEGKSFEEMAQSLERQVGAIKARLVRLELLKK